MKYFLKESTWDAGLARMRWLFDEFENIIVNFSGGKDSTATLNLALKIAEEKGRLPLPVLFIDQEAEWQSVINYVREIMHDPRVDARWLQCPLKIFNATSTTEPWLYCWEPGREWVREKEPDSVHDNTFGTDRFTELFEAYNVATWGDAPVCHLAGVRAEESPARLRGLTSYATYKAETWGRKEHPRRRHFTMYPLYDWSYTDIWKAIHQNGWPYCPIYDLMYQHGVPLNNMRVSNVHHETAVKTLFYVQEIEGETWDRVTQRLSGINTAGILRKDFFIPKLLPPGFSDWYDYRDHLIDNLITDPKLQRYYRDTFARMDARFNEEGRAILVKTEIACILSNDHHGTKLTTFEAAYNGKYSLKTQSVRNAAREARDVAA